MIWELLKRTVHEFSDDDCMHMAAGIAYYTLFSIFPLLLGLIAVLGLVLEPAEVQGRVLEIVTEVFPASADLVIENIEGVIASRGAIGVLSVVGLIWSATAIFAAIRRSLNRAWDVERQRPLLKQKLLELEMVAGVGLLFLVSAAATAFFQMAWQLLQPDLQVAKGTPLLNLAAVPLPIVISFIMFALVYRIVPNTRITWGDVWPGALLAAVLFEVVKRAFGWYLTTFANYSLVYGSLGAIIAFLFWAYASALILLLGAELASEYSRLLGSQREQRLGNPREGVNSSSWIRGTRNTNGEANHGSY